MLSRGRADDATARSRGRRSIVVPLHDAELFFVPASQSASTQPQPDREPSVSRWLDELPRVSAICDERRPFQAGAFRDAHTPMTPHSTPYDDSPIFLITPSTICAIDIFGTSPMLS